MTNIITAEGVAANFVPINQTSHFTVGQQVDVICTVRGLTKGQTHVVSIHWFYDGLDMGIPTRPGQTEQSINNNSVVYFGLSFPTPVSVWQRSFSICPATLMVMNPMIRILREKSPSQLTQLLWGQVCRRQLESPRPQRFYIGPLPRGWLRCDATQRPDAPSKEAPHTGRCRSTKTASDHVVDFRR